MVSFSLHVFSNLKKTPQNGACRIISSFPWVLSSVHQSDCCGLGIPKDNLLKEEWCQLSNQDRRECSSKGRQCGAEVQNPNSAGLGLNPLLLTTWKSWASPSPSLFNESLPPLFREDSNGCLYYGIVIKYINISKSSGRMPGP